MCRPQIITNFLNTADGQDVIEAEAHEAYDIGMYTMQRQIYPVLQEKISEFDPVAMTLP